MKSKTQVLKNIKDVCVENNWVNSTFKTNRMTRSMASTGDREKGAAIELNIFLAQNKGKGPPGRPRSPADFSPDRVQNPVRGITNSPIHSLNSKFSFGDANTNDFETITNTENDNYKKYKFYFIQLLNSITMKKQIFILAFFVLAIFAGINKSYGQGAKTGTAPQTTTCVNDALHPTAGIPYGYTLDGTPAGGTWTWWATKKTDFVKTGALETAGMLIKGTNAGDLVDVSSNYGTAGAGSVVTITWSESVLSGTSYQGAVSPGTPTFVVGYYKAASPACSDNIKIYELDPKPSFIVDILSLNPTTHLPDATTYTYSPAQCVDVVQSATYNAAHKILYDYGTNYLYYEFVAANFSDYWVPTFALTGTDTKQTITYEYTYDAPATWNASTVWTTLTSATTHLNVDSSVANTAAGVSTYVRVTVKNNDFETLADQTLVMNLDGQNKIGTWDVINSSCTATTAADQNDKSTQTITKRPTVVEGTQSPLSPNLKLIPNN